MLILIAIVQIQVIITRFITNVKRHADPDLTDHNVMGHYIDPVSRCWTCSIHCASLHGYLTGCTMCNLRCQLPQEEKEHFGTQQGN